MGHQVLAFRSSPVGAFSAPAPRTGQRRPRIAFIAMKLAGRGGGAERVLIETANALHARGYDVDIVTYDPRKVPTFYPIAFGVRRINLLTDEPRWRAKLVSRLAKWRVANPLRWWLSYGQIIRALRGYLATTSPDAAIAFLPPAMTVTALAAWGTGVPVLHSTHNAPQQDFENRDKYDRNPIDIWLRRRTLRLAARILVLLPDYRDWYGALRGRVRVIGNPVTPVADPLRPRAKIILSVGRLNPVKRQDLLIAAWARIAPEFPDWRVELCGEGTTEPQLRAQIALLGLSDSVTLIGQTTDIAGHYARASILAHPAAYEGFPLAVSEALAAGVPVVGFADCSGLNRLVEDGVNGVLVTAGSDPIAALAAALKALIQNEGWRVRLGRAGPPSMAPYTPETIYDQWEAVLREIAPVAPSPRHANVAEWA